MGNEKSVIENKVVEKSADENTKTSIHFILLDIQQKLDAPKSQFNQHGKYSYRSTEDIIAGLKDLLKEHKCTILLQDEIVLVADRVYIKATATLSSSTENITISAFAREPLIQEGMNEAQITGSVSSYARKYALNGLFAIDDVKDSDAQDNNTQDSDVAYQNKASSAIAQQHLITVEQHEDLKRLLQDKSIDYNNACKDWNLKSLKELQINSLPTFKNYIG